MTVDELRRALLGDVNGLRFQRYEREERFRHQMDELVKFVHQHLILIEQT